MSRSRNTIRKGKMVVKIVEMRREVELDIDNDDDNNRGLDTILKNHRSLIVV